jgi:hypothetical protein
LVSALSLTYGCLSSGNSIGALELGHLNKISIKWGMEYFEKHIP